MQVAIKLLARPGEAASRERLLEEIRILARLEHPNIARLIDGGVDSTGIPYLVMEYIAGETMPAFCGRANLSIADRVRVFKQVLEGVSFAHRQLVVHCDIKPSNILVDQNGQVKLIDFGIAALIESLHATQNK